MAVKKYGWATQKSLSSQTNQDSTFSHTCENSKIFYKLYFFEYFKFKFITSEYFSFFNTKPTAN